MFQNKLMVFIIILNIKYPPKGVFRTQGFNSTFVKYLNICFRIKLGVLKLDLAFHSSLIVGLALYVVTTYKIYLHALIKYYKHADRISNEKYLIKRHIHEIT